MDSKAQLQQAGRALLSLEALEKASPENINRLSESCYKELTRLRPYEAHLYPELLVFEAVGNIGLYEGQVKDLERMLKPKTDENPNVILEKVMGSGKTKVYLPLLALSKADGDHLSFVVVHSSQYETVAKAMEIGSGETFDQAAHTIHFTRESDTSVPALKLLLKECEKVRTDRDFLIVTDKTLHNLSLTYDLLWDAYLESTPPNEDLVGRITVMKEILNLFKNKGKATFDEADLLLNTRFETVYAMGDKVTIEAKRRDVVIDIFKCVAPFMDALTPYTDEAYEEIKPALIQKFIDEVVPKQIDSVALKDYFSNGEKGSNYVENLSSDEQQLLAIARYHFQDLLKVVLSRRCGEHYGYSDNPEKKLPVPYVASGVPNPTAEFAFPYALLDYAFLTLEKSGPTPALLTSIITNLQNKARLEMQANHRLSLAETKAYKEFIEITGKNSQYLFFKMTPEDFTSLSLALKADHPHRYEFAKKYLFPEVTLHPRKLTSTPYRLYNMLLQVQGFTGTPYNSDTYPMGIETLRDLQSAGKTLGIVWKNSKIVHTFGLAGVKSASDIISRMPIKDYHAFIDVGATFNGLANIDVAKALLRDVDPSIKGVVFYHDNLPVVLERGKTTPTPIDQCGLKPEELFVYYDQWHTTGTDHKIGGKSLISIDRNNKLRDFEQGYMRDRQAAIGPRVDLIVSEEDLSCIKTNLGLDSKAQITPAEIIRSLELNQEREIDDQMLMGAFASMKETLDNHVRNLFLDPAISPIELIKHAAALRALIGDSVTDDPYAQFGGLQKDMPREEFIQNIIESTLLKAEPFISLSKGRVTKLSLKNELEQCFRFQLLPKTISSSAANTPDQAVEKESQQNVQQERMAQVQKNQMGEISLPDARGAIHWNWLSKLNSKDPSFYQKITVQELKERPLPTMKVDEDTEVLLPESTGQVPILSLNSILSESGLEAYKDVFDIDVSYNFMPVIGQTRLKGVTSVCEMVSFSAKGLDVHTILFVQNKGQTEAILLSETDAGFFYDKLAQDRHNEGSVEATLYHTTLGTLQGNAPVEDKALLKLIIQAKFFNGESLYREEELPLLKAWIQEKGPARMEKLFTDHILQNKPDKSGPFHQSSLHDLFKELV